jgi:hypothetical protein
MNIHILLEHYYFIVIESISISPTLQVSTVR